MSSTGAVYRIAWWSGTTVIALLGIALMLIAAYSFYIGSRFSSNDCEHTQGIIDQLNRGSGRSSTMYSVKFHYSTENSTNHAECGSSGETWHSLRAGNALPVKYLKDAPEIAQIDLPREDIYQRNQPWYPLILGTLIDCYCGYIVWKKLSSES